MIALSLFLGNLHAGLWHNDKGWHGGKPDDSRHGSTLARFWIGVTVSNPCQRMVDARALITNVVSRGAPKMDRSDVNFRQKVQRVLNIPLPR